jgi:hypothetical protein
MVSKTIANPSQTRSTTTTSATASSRLDRALTTVREFAPELAKLLDAWPTLPSALKTGVLAMVDAARK